MRLGSGISYAAVDVEKNVSRTKSIDPPSNKATRRAVTNWLCVDYLPMLKALTGKIGDNSCEIHHAIAVCYDALRRATATISMT
mmetsp:Transcript_25107/g.35888  ORF Transcript_25107/g.35888 Transcript_25107/m.35888 type:complete len:84 (+) Transcript_25107:1203-1454(+)